MAVGSFSFADYSTIPCDGQCRTRQLFPCRRCSHRKQRKADRRCIQYAIRRAWQAGHCVYFGTSKPGINLTPTEASNISRQFQKTVRKSGWQIFWTLEITPRNHARLHWHYVIIASTPIEAGTVNALFAAVVPSAGQACSTKISNIQSAKAVARYLAGETKAKGQQPLFRVGLRIRTRGSTANFFGEPKAKLDKRLVEDIGVRLAVRLMLCDGFILEHPTLDYYLQMEQQQYNDRRYQPRQSSLMNGYILDGLA